jgi:hypothetical protein
MIASVLYGVGGYDPSKPNDNVIETVTLEVIDGVNCIVTTTPEGTTSRPATLHEMEVTE